MQDDNLYPNDGRAFLAEPEDQVEERNKEKAETLQALPIIEDTILRFKEQIAHLGNVNSIPADILMDKEKVGAVLLANKMAAEKLTVEKEWLEDLVERYFMGR